MGSTDTEPAPSAPPPRLPRHVAIVMDGNGRWAQRRHLPRYAGHRAGVKTVRAIVEHCVNRGIGVLTLFAFSSENWSRPQQEVSLLMDLFMSALRSEVKRMQKNGVRLRIIGERSAFPEKLQARILEAEQLTAGNHTLELQIAANYGGRWDMTQAARRLAQQVKEGRLEPEAIDEETVASALSFADRPDPDLFIRTGGEQRVSNFILWQAAYAEFYFSDLLWPDFDEAALDAAIADFGRRQRRFGKTGEQAAEETG